MRSFVPPKGALSRFTNPLRSLMFRLRPMEGQTVCGSMGSRAAHQTAFIMRRLIVKYWLSILITGNWSCTVPDLGCRHTKKKIFTSFFWFFQVCVLLAHLDPRNHLLVPFKVFDHPSAALRLLVRPWCPAVYEVH